MSGLNQKTIKKNICLKGIGLHSGNDVSLTIKPAKPNSGIIFKRVDIKNNNMELAASILYSIPIGGAHPPRK